ncbi:magnesium/cobalt transporter CorA [Paenibacillus harenae]|uniref:Magnesium transport protein CorA n=1 Tax=Paenibacillus harenae TaxID=306543 RepID=A0ABT9UAQ6_PAEHA|nr:magnesium/cobalt transporter CorA [Paenibacillus harenae]MDQ0116715.1 magnesium transporter [Paenibacillus harenae]
MIRIVGYSKDKKWRTDLTLEQVSSSTELAWYWVDFDQPSVEESKLLSTHFKFHPLAIEDCYHLLQRPKMDHYDDTNFLILHAFNGSKTAADEVNMFIGPRFLVTFHHGQSQGIESARTKLLQNTKPGLHGHLCAAYLVMDKLVDEYFPVVQELEEMLIDMDLSNGTITGDGAITDIFSIRSRLLRLRKTIIPMRDLLYRLVNSDRIEGLGHYLAFYRDIHDHLLKLSEMLDNCREMTADLRDSYISYNSNRMNTIMKTLTVITTIFMPLTFLAGIYGMNFHVMPELEWRWGYFVVLGFMLLVALSMFAWFNKKGWFK